MKGPGDCVQAIAIFFTMVSLDITHACMAFKILRLIIEGGVDAFCSHAQ